MRGFLTVRVCKHSVVLPIVLAACVSSASAQQTQPVNILAGAKAFITPTEARFVFPRQIRDSYVWDVPAPGVLGGSGGYDWAVSWDTPPDRVRIDPCEIWLVQYWKSGGPRKGGLKDLIQWLRLEPLIKDTSYVGIRPMRKVDHNNVFATVEDGQLIFIVRGADAVRRIFPTIPSRVKFSAGAVDAPEPNYGVSSIVVTKTVTVDGQTPEKTSSKPPRCLNISERPD